MSTKIFLSAIALLTLVLFGCQQEPLEQGEVELIDALSKKAPDAFKTDKYLVVAHEGVASDGLRKKLEAAGATVTSEWSELGVVAVTTKNVSRISRLPEVQWVAPNLTLQWYHPVTQEEFLADAANPPFTNDDDFLFDIQWGFDAMDVPEAWELGYKGKDVRVAVLDGGFYTSHPDLAANVNLALSANFVPDELLEYVPTPEIGTFSHGTHVAGTIAAPDNGTGVIGVAPEAELVLVKVLADSGSGSFESIIAGIYHAAMVDSDVINMSLGASIPQGIGIGSNQIAGLRVAVDRAVDFAHKSGAVVITSAGNDGTNANFDKSTVVFPASSPKAVAISATAPYGWALNPFGNLDYLASYSKRGTSLIDFAAPGGDVAWPGNEAILFLGSPFPVWIFDAVISTATPTGWSWSIGTSMASPHAAGVAALIIGKNGGSMDPSAVETILRKSSDDLGKPGKDDFYGYGRVNAYKAVQY